MMANMEIDHGYDAHGAHSVHGVHDAHEDGRGYKGPLEELPEEILIYLLHRFDAHQLCVISLLSREFNRLVNDEEIWKTLSLDKWRTITRKHEKTYDDKIGSFDGCVWKGFYSYRSHVDHNWDTHKFKKFALKGHTGTVFGVKIVDDHHVISSGEDGFLHIWNHSTKQHILAHQAHEAAIIGLDYDRDSHTVVTGASDKNVKVWKYSKDPRATVQAMSAKELKELLAKNNISARDCFEKADLVDKVLYSRLVPLVGCSNTLVGHGGAIIGVAIDHQAGLVASASFDQTARLWDLNNDGKTIYTQSNHRGTVNCVQIVDRQFLLSGGNDAKIIKADIHTGKQVQEFVGHIGWVWNLHYSPSTLLSCSIDHKIRVWDVASGRSTAVINHHTAEVCGLEANWETRKFVSSAFDGKVFFNIHWDMRNLTEPLMSLSFEERCTRAAWDENMIAVATFGHVVQLWDFTAS